MAKRKRLVVSEMPVTAPAYNLQDKPHGDALLRPAFASGLAHGAPPIAHIVADASAQAALEELTETLQRARLEGRLVQTLPLAAIDQAHLVRDRIVLDADELDTLVASIRAHGQRTPIEVTELADGRFGLISGLRRLQALQRLADETQDARFNMVLALLRRPETAVAAYIAMVEENEIRQGLSYYERARIAARAADLGVFDGEKRALQMLFAAASRARRSKIGSFLTIFRALDPVLRFPAAIPERLGLMLARKLEVGPDTSTGLIADLTQHPVSDSQDELARLQRFSADSVSAAPTAPAEYEISSGVFLKTTGNSANPVLTIHGPAVGADFKDRLEIWLSHAQ